MELNHQTSATINEDVLAWDAPPILDDDAFSLRAGAQLQLTVLEGDVDPDSPDAPNLTTGIARYSDAYVDGRVVGGLSAYGSFFVFEATDPIFDLGVHTVTFQYTAVDQWGAESDPATVTLTVTGGGPGSSAPGGGNEPGGTIGGGTLRGGNPPDLLTGGDGDDYITGGNQNDTLTGNGGADTISGDNGEDIVRGDGGNDLLLGGNGKDTITGGTGFDTLQGENGDDYLQGDAGNDVLIGANGVDTLIGGAGNDTLTGGNSPDRFVFGAGFGDDVITDFDVKGGDVIQIAEFGNFTALKAHAHQSGGDTVIDSLDGYSTLTLKNVLLSSLSSSDFSFS